LVYFFLFFSLFVFHFNFLFSLHFVKQEMEKFPLTLDHFLFNILSSKNPTGFYIISYIITFEDESHEIVFLLNNMMRTYKM
jgi:hypothetical protein